MPRLERTIIWMERIFWFVGYFLFTGIIIGLFAVVLGYCDYRQTLKDDADLREQYQALRHEREDQSVKRALPIYHHLANTYQE